MRKLIVVCVSFCWMIGGICRTNNGNGDMRDSIKDSSPDFIEKDINDMAKISGSLVRSEFIPGAFTKDPKLQEELSKFIRVREWPLDCRTLLYPVNMDYALFFNFDKTAYKIPPLNLQCEKEVLEPASVFEIKSISARKWLAEKVWDNYADSLGGKLNEELWNNFVDSLSLILAGSSNKMLHPRWMKTGSDSESSTSAYLYGQVHFNVDSGIQSYIVIVERISTGIGASFSSDTFLITQNEEQVLSILELNSGFITYGHSAVSRTIRLDGNIIVSQHEMSGDTVIVATEEEALELGLSNYASFYVYKILPNGFIVALK